MPRRTAGLLTFVLTCPLAMVACSEHRDSSSPPEQSRFEFKNDDHGRLVRLDKTTGELTVVDDPAAHTPPATKRSREKRKPVTVSTTDSAKPVTTSTCGGEHVRRVTVAVAGTPVFIQPQVLPTPLVTLPSGTELPVVESAGSWYRVQFEDTTWGPRIGYIHCGSVAAPQRPAK